MQENNMRYYSGEWRRQAAHASAQAFIISLPQFFHDGM